MQYARISLQTDMKQKHIFCRMHHEEEKFYLYDEIEIGKNAVCLE